MIQSEKLKGLLSIENVSGYTYVNAEDGSIITNGGITPGYMDEVVAYIGSAGEILSSKFNLRKLNCIKIDGREKFVILKPDENYLGIMVDKFDDETINKIIGIIYEEDLTGDPKILKVLNTKARQLSLLIEEFSKGSDPEKWKNLLVKAIEILDQDKKFEKLLRVEGMELVVKGAKGLDKDIVDKFMKMLLDFLVKEAIKEFGNDEAKNRVHNVIERLSKEKK
uniref:Roadblock/LAMTOR2 domain-containing protein n=1 Tax=candidate division WOR-3 bacterium TaxID=2052148 RepID=A0A7C4U7S4_UNCW3